MTIQLTFQQGSQRVAIRVIQDNVLFIDLETNMMAPIEGLNFNRQGVINEYPDLKDDKDWKQKAIQRFADKVKSFQTENQKANWLIQEMKDMGYKPLYKQRNGFRAEKIK